MTDPVNVQIVSGKAVRGHTGSGIAIEGINGTGEAAVKGDSSRGVGVFGKSDLGAGGKFEGGVEGPGLVATAKAGGSAAVFTSEVAGQIKLNPHTVEFQGDNSYPRLSSVGSPGEIKALVGKNGKCSLWLCVKGVTWTGGSTPLPRMAEWCEIQLGPAIAGTE